MRSRRSLTAPSPRRGFTLIEILVVIGIILLLAALLFPAFQGAQERAQQASCLSNLQQIYLAARLYKDDEREYPMSLGVLLPDTAILQNTAGAADSSNGVNMGGTGYFRKPAEVLLCPDDDTDLPATDANGVAMLRSSYGDLTNAPTKKASYESAANYDARDAAFYADGQSPDWGRLSWNYWGYDSYGVAFRSADEALAYLATLPAADARRLLKTPDKKPGSGYVPPPPNMALWQSQMVYFNPRGLARDASLEGAPFLEEPREENPLRYSLSNRFAPEGTIITHCVYHRLPTSNNLYGPNPRLLYANPADAAGARDMVLRVDGTVKSYDISDWQKPKDGRPALWQISEF